MGNFPPMSWKRVFACITGSVDEQLMLQNEYLVTENRIQRRQLPERFKLSPKRGKRMSRGGFIRTQSEVLAAVDFFTAHLWTTAGLTTDKVLACVRIASRQVCIAAIPTSPDQHWIEHKEPIISPREAVGFLSVCRCLLHNRDANFCPAFDSILKAAGIHTVKLHPEARGCAIESKPQIIHED